MIESWFFFKCNTIALWENPIEGPKKLISISVTIKIYYYFELEGDSEQILKNKYLIFYKMRKIMRRINKCFSGYLYYNTGRGIEKKATP